MFDPPDILPHLDRLLAAAPRLDDTNDVQMVSMFRHEWSLPVNTHDAPAGSIAIGLARGLLNPFTGETMALAELSGRTAAAAILDHRDDPARALTSYDRRLRQHLHGIPLNGSNGIRRHELAFRVLTRTLTDPNPYFQAMRRNLLLPGGSQARVLSGSSTDDVPVPGFLTTYLAGCDLAIGRHLSRHWPSLVAASGRTRPADSVLRPSALLAIACLLLGRKQLAQLVPLGAALDLSAIGGLAQASAGGGALLHERETDLHSGTSVLMADYCFAWGLRLASDYGPWISEALAGWMVDIAELRASREQGYVYYSRTFEMAMRLGSQLSDGSPAEVSLLGDLGRLLGQLFGASEEVLSRRGLTHHLGCGIDGLVGVGLASSDHPQPPHGTDALVEIARSASADGERAREVLDHFPDSPTKKVLIACLRRLVYRTSTQVDRPQGGAAPVLRRQCGMPISRSTRLAPRSGVRKTRSHGPDPPRDRQGRRRAVPRRSDRHHRTGGGDPVRDGPAGHAGGRRPGTEIFEIAEAGKRAAQQDADERDADHTPSTHPTAD